MNERRVREDGGVGVEKELYTERGNRERNRERDEGKRGTDSKKEGEREGRRERGKESKEEREGERGRQARGGYNIRDRELCP